MITLIVALCALVFLFIFRVVTVVLVPLLPLTKPPSTTLRTMVVLGSGDMMHNTRLENPGATSYAAGGHTAEMVALLKAMDHTRYTPRTYIVAETDSGSSSKAESLEKVFAQAAEKAGGAAGSADGSAYRMVKIPRSREVGQSFLTSFLTTVWACFHALWIVFRDRPQLLLCNGPGTCVPIVGAAVLMRIVRRPTKSTQPGGLQRVSTACISFLGWGRCGVVYVESIARVQKLSLTGLILYKMRLADAFFVQWEELAAGLPRALYLGRLM